MKMNALIHLLDFGYAIPVQLSVQNTGKLFLSSDEALVFWKDLDLMMFERMDSIAERKRKQRLFMKEMSISPYDDEYPFYYALYSIFLIAGNWLKEREPTFDVKSYASYYTLVHLPVVEEELMMQHDFSEVSTMEKLIHVIQNNYQLKQEMFDFDIYECMKDKPDQCEKLHFGNVMKREPYERVHVELFKDSAIVRSKTEIHTYLLEDVQAYTVEDKMLQTIQMWSKDTHPFIE